MEDEGTVIRGDVDVLMLHQQLWVLVIEAKRSAVEWMMRCPGCSVW